MNGYRARHLDEHSKGTRAPSSLVRSGVAIKASNCHCGERAECRVQVSQQCRPDVCETIATEVALARDAGRRRVRGARRDSDAGGALSASGVRQVYIENSATPTYGTASPASLDYHAMCREPAPLAIQLSGAVFENSKRINSAAKKKANTQDRGIDRNTKRGAVYPIGRMGSGRARLGALHQQRIQSRFPSIIRRHNSSGRAR